MATKKDYPKYDYLTNKELTWEDNDVIKYMFKIHMENGVNPLDIMVESWDVQYQENGSIFRELHLSYKK